MWKLAKWEKVFYSLILIISLLITLFDMYATVASYLQNPKGVGSGLEPVEPYRYPWVIAVPKDQSAWLSGFNDTEKLATALLYPSNVSVEAMRAVERMSEDQIKAAAAAGLDLEGQKTKILGPCSDVVELCYFDGQMVDDCCKKGQNMLTKQGLGFLLDVSREMNPVAPLVKELKIQFKKPVFLSLTEMGTFYSKGGYLTSRGSRSYLRIEVFQYLGLEGWFGSHVLDPDHPMACGVEECRYDLGKKDENEIWEQQGEVYRQCGCKFLHDSQRNRDGMCLEKTEIACAKAAIDEFEAGQLYKNAKDGTYKSAPESRARRSQQHFTIVPTGTEPEAPGRSSIVLTYESPFKSVMREYMTMSFAELFRRMGSSLAIYVSEFLVIVFIIQLCKLCCRCCRADETVTYA